MGAAKDLWMDEVERVGQDFAAENLTRDEALAKLRHLGFDRQEADDMLTAVVA